MTFFDAALMMTTLLCALVAGIVLGFAVVVMPGIAKLSDRYFLLAFQRIDRVIQNNQPVFILVWVGSIVATILMLVFGTLELTGSNLYLMWFAGALYLFAVQAPTILFNIPLNNAVQALDIEALNDTDLAEARNQFEVPWNWWNRFRTLTATTSVVALLMLQWLLR